MAIQTPRRREGYRQIRVIFDPFASGHTSVSVFTVDYLGTARLAHRIGSVDLRVGYQDLVGLTPTKVTALLVSRLYEFLVVKRSYLVSPVTSSTPRAARSAPPEGDMGAVVGSTVNVPLPGL